MKGTQRTILNTHTHTHTVLGLTNVAQQFFLKVELSFFCGLIPFQSSGETAGRKKPSPRSLKARASLRLRDLVFLGIPLSYLLDSRSDKESG